MDDERLSDEEAKPEVETDWLLETERLFDSSVDSLIELEPLTELETETEPELLLLTDSCF